jgi:formylmethanofuran:tetrahydromethanopterin formyltransferase
MPRKSDAIYTNYPLPEGSNALNDLDAFCEEWGNISRADATQRLIIAWSKARRGDLAAFGAMGITLSVISAPTAGSTETPAPAAPTPDNKPVVPRRVTNGNAKAVELDL